MARAICSGSLRGQRRVTSGTLLSGHRNRASSGRDREWPEPHPAHSGHRHRQDIYRLPDRVETVSFPLEPERTANAAPTNPFPRGPEYPGRSGLQRFLRVPRGRVGAHCARRYPQEGQGAEERQLVLHDLPDVHERTAEGWQSEPVCRGVSAGLFRFHRHRRVPPRRRER